MNGKSIASWLRHNAAQIDGVEFAGNYQLKGIATAKDVFNAYANMAVSQALGENIISNQYEFSAHDLAYIRNHGIYLDHACGKAISALAHRSASPLGSV